jgi:hypothetical protein
MNHGSAVDTTFSVILIPEREGTAIRVKTASGFVGQNKNATHLRAAFVYCI